MDTIDKVRPEHLSRNAYVYVRQSTLRQVSENKESLQRQYALRDRALQLGWDCSRVVVIDCDLGLSATGSAGREGFQKLVAEVGLRRAGIVIGLEVSRLARNSSDWYGLLELCSATGTLILDQDGIYDPVEFNDRMLLGLKGTISDAEIHVLRSRMRGGILNKARRAELAIPLPVGFLYEAGRVILDPDSRVQDSIRNLFSTFARCGSVAATVRTFREKGWSFPVRSSEGPRPGDLRWVELTVNRVNHILRNPRYAGAYAYGQHRHRRKTDGSGARLIQRVPRKDWFKLERDAHAGYLSWDEYERHLETLRNNAPHPRGQADGGAPREGPALLQGLLYCGRCGAAMHVRYHDREGQLVPDYYCQRHTVNQALPPCQAVSGRSLDAAVSRIVLDSVTRKQLELSIAVQQEIDQQKEAWARLHRSTVDQADYEASLAERRFKRVDPDNRLVAGTLEAEWNQKLTQLSAARQEYTRLQEATAVITAETRARILALAEDLPRVWNHPQTADRDRKRFTRLLLQDVTVVRDGAQKQAHIRFKSGATHTIDLPGRSSQPDTRLLELINNLRSQNQSYSAISDQLNELGMRTIRGKRYTPQSVTKLHAGSPGRSADNSPNLPTAQPTEIFEKKGAV